MNGGLILTLGLAFKYIQKEETMEITQIETKLTDTRVELIEHQEKTQEFKNNVQEIFIDVFNQEEFSQNVDAIFNEIFKGDRR